MLNDAKIKATRPGPKPIKLGDSGQLYLLVSPAGGRHWRMNYTYGVNAAGKPAQKTLSFGSYPAVTLLKARDKRDEAKKMLAEGKDPAVERKEAEAASAATAVNTFRKVAIDWFELSSGWDYEKLTDWRKAHDGKARPVDARHWTKDFHGQWSHQHALDVITSLERDVFDSMGTAPIAALKAPKVLETLKAVEKRGAIETAHRLRQRISAIFVYGIAAGICDSDPAASIGAALKDVPKAKPQPSIIDRHRDLDARVTAIRQLLIDCEAERCRAATKLALRLIALTAVRPGELAGAEWSEFDIDGKAPTWTIPAARMKGDKDRKAEEHGEHLVPLSTHAVEVLRALRPLTGHLRLLFPSERHSHRPISENTLRALLIRAGYYQRHVPHGFRAAFSTIMNERADTVGKEGDRAVIDLMLAHLPQGKSGSETAYNRAGYMPRRRELAQEWADLLVGDMWGPETHLDQPIRYAATGPGRG